MKTFTDDTLREAREKLLARGALLTERIQRVKADLRREHEPLPLDPPDAASVRENDDVLLAIEKSAYAEISRIEAALERMEAGTFGLCEECGKEIEAARFVALPDATRCKTCARDG
jgi:RNA polymerase-binding transcription factor DksA